MIDLSALQDAIGARLAGMDEITEIAPRANSRSVFPYATLGAVDEVDDSTDFVTRSLVTFSVHVWTRGNLASIEAKQIAGRVRDRLAGADLAIPGHVCLGCHYRTTRYLGDPDDDIDRAAIEFAIDIQPAP